MSAFLLRTVLLVQVVGLELLLLGRAGRVTPDLSAILVAFCVLEVRASRVLSIVVPLACARALLEPGGLVFHLWLLLAAYIVHLPLRRVLFAGRWQLQMLVGATCAWLLSAVQGWLLTGDGVDPLGRGVLGILLSGVMTPGWFLLLPFVFRRYGPRRRAARDAEAEFSS